MSLSTTALRLTFDALHYSGIASLARPWAQGLGVIFCMHRVQPDAGQAAGFRPNANLTSTPGFLDASLSMLRREGYEFLSLDAAADRIANGGQGHRPFAVFTLDDGYRDNLEHALPVFEKHMCPFAVYVTPGFVDGTSEMWWMALEKIIDRGAGRNIAVGGTQRTLGASDASKQAAWNVFLPLVQELPEHEQRAWIRQQAAAFGVDMQQMCRAEIMSWDELRTMEAHPLATIGAHTLNHFAVARLSENEARAEISGSGQRLERELGKPVQHFAFPYGNVGHAGPRDFRLCRESGYATAVTTRLGTVFADHAKYMYALPRVMVSGKYQEPRWLQVLASGLPGRMMNKGRCLNVD